MFKKTTLSMSIALLMTVGVASAADVGATDAPSLLNADPANANHLTNTKNVRTGKLSFLSVDSGYAVRSPSSLTADASKEQVVRSFVSIYGSQFGLQNQADELVVSKLKNTEDGRTIARLKQVYKNIPVYGAELMVAVDAGNNLRSINGNIAPDVNISIDPKVVAQEARAAALAVVASSYSVLANTLEVSEPELIIFNASVVGMPGGTENILAWKSVVSGIPSSFDAKTPIKEQVIIDASNGKTLSHINLIEEAKYRKTYNYKNTSTTAALIRSEGQSPVASADVNNAHALAGSTYDFYKLYHYRDGINNLGMTMKSKVKYSVGYCNAFWWNNEMTYGDGCSLIVDDVVAHELTHGVTQYESGLIYSYQSGAINEAFSDIWGEFVDLKTWDASDTAANRWLIGEATSIGAIRNMKNPPAFNDPDRVHSPLYYCGTADNGGVHWNSGVANKAAYLITDGGTFNGYTITGLGISKTAKLFYEVQTNILTSSATYSSLNAALNQACINKHYTTNECLQVTNAGLATEMNLAVCP